MTDDPPTTCAPPSEPVTLESVTATVQAIKDRRRADLTAAGLDVSEASDKHLGMVHAALPALAEGAESVAVNGGHVIRADGALLCVETSARDPEWLLGMPLTGLVP